MLLEKKYAELLAQANASSSDSSSSSSSSDSESDSSSSSSESSEDDKKKKRKGRKWNNICDLIWLKEKDEWLMIKETIIIN